MRPIVNSCHLAKAFDRIVSDQLVDFLEENNCLSDMQSGFRKNYSTQTSLLHLADELRRNIDGGFVTILISFDFRLAFNSVWHLFLLFAARGLNFDDSSIELLHHFLSGRCINVDGTVPESCSCGIGQGTGPAGTLFNVAIDTAITSFTYCEVDLFADDLRARLRTRLCDISDAVKRINLDICSFAAWAANSGFSLNPIKTNAMIVGSFRSSSLMSDMEIPHISINGIEIPYVRSFKQLGVHIDDRLTWYDHVSYQLLKINRSLFFLQANCRSLPRNVRKQLVSAVVMPHFEYASALFTNLSVTVNNKLESAFRRAVRFVFVVKNNYDTQPLLAKLKWLPLAMRRLYFVALQLFKILKSHKPNYLFERFAEQLQHHASEVRRPTPFKVPLFNTESYKKSYIVTAIHLWNKIPSQIRDSQTVPIFKSRLLPFLLQQNPELFLNNLYNSNYSVSQFLEFDVSSQLSSV